MKKKSNINLIIGVIIAVILIAVAIRLTFDNSPKAQNESFVRTQLLNLTDGDSYVVIKNVVIYIDEENTFLFIDYDITYDNETNYSYIIVNKTTGQFVRLGYQDTYPEFMSEYKETKTNYKSQIIYDASDIERMNVGH